MMIIPNAYGPEGNGGKFKIYRYGGGGKAITPNAYGPEGNVGNFQTYRYGGGGRGGEAIPKQTLPNKGYTIAGQAGTMTKSTSPYYRGLSGNEVSQNITPNSPINQIASKPANNISGTTTTNSTVSTQRTAEELMNATDTDALNWQKMYGGTYQKKQDLINEYKKAQEEAKAANEARYGEIKGGYDTMLAEQLKMLEGSGEQEKADIEREWTNKETQGMQDLISQGMSASTIKPTMSMGYARNKNADIGRLNQRLLDTRMNTYGNITGSKLNFMERREDIYPDINQLMALAEMQGMTNSGSGGLNIPAGFGSGVGSSSGGGGGGSSKGYSGSPWKSVRTTTKQDTSTSKTRTGSAQNRADSLSGNRFSGLKSNFKPGYGSAVRKGY